LPGTTQLPVLPLNKLARKQYIAIMKSYRSLAFIVSSIFLMYSCKKSLVQPLDFDVAVNVLNATFTSNAPGATSYSWDFGDNQFSNDQHPAHRYSYGGLYNVRVTVSGPGGTSILTKEVRIASPTIMKIKEVKVLSYDTTKTWDVSDGPDIFWKLSDYYSPDKWSGNVVNNVTTAALPLVWKVNPEIVITNFSTKYLLEIWDNDGPSAETFMGGYLIPAAYLKQMGHPTNAIINTPNLPTTFALTLEWQ
jgi:hypothetical protein